MMIFIQVSPTNSIDYLPYNSIQHAVTEGMNHITSMTKSTLMPHIARYNNFNYIWNSENRFTIVACISPEVVYIAVNQNLLRVKWISRCIIIPSALPYLGPQYCVRIIWDSRYMKESLFFWYPSLFTHYNKITYNNTTEQITLKYAGSHNLLLPSATEMSQI